MRQRPLIGQCAGNPSPGSGALLALIRNTEDLRHHSSSGKMGRATMPSYPLRMWTSARLRTASKTTRLLLSPRNRRPVEQVSVDQGSRIPQHRPQRFPERRLSCLPAPRHDRSHDRILSTDTDPPGSDPDVTQSLILSCSVGSCVAGGGTCYGPIVGAGCNYGSRDNGVLAERAANRPGK